LVLFFCRMAAVSLTAAQSSASAGRPCQRGDEALHFRIIASETLPIEVSQSPTFQERR